jgi:hypothetical protein
MLARPARAVGRAAAGGGRERECVHVLMSVRVEDVGAGWGEAGGVRIRTEVRIRVRVRRASASGGASARARTEGRSVVRETYGCPFRQSSVCHCATICYDLRKVNWYHMSQAWIQSAITDMYPLSSSL